MRILLVTPDYPPPPGGIQTLTKNLELGLIHLGNEVRVLDLDPGDRIKLGDMIPRIWIDSLQQLPRWPYFNRVYAETLQTIRKFNPDIIHAIHVVCWPALQAAEEKSIPSVVSIHAKELQSNHFAQSAFSRANRIHAVSEFTATLANDIIDTVGRDVYVTHPSVEVPETIPRDTSGGPVFCISRLVERKNVVTLIEAWKKLPEHLRKEHGLVIAGDGEQKPRINEISSKDDTIEVVGRISDDEKNRYLKKSSLFALLPIRKGYDVEGFGIVYIEAQANGTLVLGSKTGGVPEAIGQAGKVVNDPLDSSDTAEKLQELLENDSLRIKKHGCLRARINCFNLEPIARQHMSQYERILGRGSKNPGPTMDETK